MSALITWEANLDTKEIEQKQISKILQPLTIEKFNFFFQIQTIF